MPKLNTVDRVAISISETATFSYHFCRGWRKNKPTVGDATPVTKA